jgi:hypothetical protein
VNTTTIPVPAPIARTAVLTNRGHCAQALYRFVRVLRELDDDDRAAVLKLLSAEIEAIPATV